jgi:hypothetical protein
MNDIRPTSTTEARQIVEDELADIVDQNALWDEAKIVFGTQDEEKKKAAYPVFAEDIYIAELKDMQLVRRKGYMTEELETQVECLLNLLKTDNGEIVSYSDGKAADRTFYKCWFNPERTGYNRKTGSALPFRQLVTALMGVPVTSAIPNFKPEDLLGKKVKVVMSIGAKKTTGEPKNEITKYMLVK